VEIGAGPYSIEAATRAENEKNPANSLRSALLAVSLTDGFDDSRVTLLRLADLWRGMEAKGVDPAPHYQEIGELSSDEEVHVIGGPTKGMILQMLDEHRRDALRWPAARAGGVPADGADEASQSDREKLQGAWTVVAVSEKSAGDLKGRTFTFAGHRVTIQGTNSRTDGLFTLDAAKTPKEIDFSWGEGQFESVERAIYELEGGILKLGSHGRYQSRPIGFHESTLVLTLEREKTPTGHPA
jgi:uncharacterized protein (TIGR03067 family)